MWRVGKLMSHQNGILKENVARRQESIDECQNNQADALARSPPIQPKVELSKNKKKSYPVSSNLLWLAIFPLIISRHHNNSRKKSIPICFIIHYYICHVALQNFKATFIDFYL
jgi:hypothetical protein